MFIVMLPTWMIFIFVLPRLISFKSFCHHLQSIRCGLKRLNSYYTLLKWQFPEYLPNTFKEKKNDWKHFQDRYKNLKGDKRKKKKKNQDPDIQYVCRSPEFFFYNLNKSQLNKPWFINILTNNTLSNIILVDEIMYTLLLCVESWIASFVV